MDPENKKKIKGVIEALLFVSCRPLPLKEIRDIVSDVAVIPEKELLPIMKALTSEYEELERSFRLEETAQGYLIRTRAEFAPWISKLYEDRKAEKLSQAVLETMAIVAYRQPITKSEVEAVRGVDVTGSLKKCLDLGLVKVVGKKEILGRPFMYGTTDLFLKQFGLKNLDELPQIEELREAGTGQKELDLKEEKGEESAPSEESPEKPEDTSERSRPEEPEAVESATDNREGTA